MKFALALTISLVLHGWLSQWRWAEKMPDAGSAGRAAVAIQQMRFVQAPKPQLTKPLKRVNTTEQPQVEKSALLATAVENPVEQVAATQPKPASFEQEYVEPEHAELKTEQPVVEEPVLTQIDELDAVEVMTTAETEAEYAGFDQLPIMEQPRYRKAFPPKYPRLAKRRGQQGLVMVKAKVGTDGLVENAQILASSGYQSLDSRALQTVEQWEFHPYKNGNQLAAAWVEVPVEFTLSH